MPAWKGWAEKDVRQRSSRPASGMAGFTPINAPTSTVGGNAKDSHASPAATNADAQAKSIVTDYLGRGAAEQSASATSQALHGPGAKKNSGKGKKRASTTTAASSKPKRRKSGDVSEGMAVSKAGAHHDLPPTKQIATGASDSEKAAANPETQPSKGRQRKRVAANVDSNDAVQHVSESSHAVPVYSQPTSMDSLQTTTQLTSLDVLKKSSGKGATLYNNRQRPEFQQGGDEIAQPLLNKIPPPLNGNASERTMSKAAQQSTLEPVQEEEADIDLLFDSLPQELPATVGRTTKKKRSNEQLPTPVHSDAPLQAAAPREQPSRQAKKVARAPTIQTDEDFIVSDDSDAEAMAEATAAAERKERIPPPRERKLNMRDVHADEDYGGALLSEAEKRLLRELQNNARDAVKPILRMPFPTPVLDRSPIFGATNASILRTCFRIGEAMNVGCQAVRANKNVLLELYARVTQSTREQKKSPSGRQQQQQQHFIFHDLYHDKPPHLEGTFALWDQSRLWDLDSKVFLAPEEQGKKCRVIARMKRDGQKWRLEVLGIWEADWEDVEVVAGIYRKRDESAVLTVGDD